MILLSSGCIYPPLIPVLVVQTLQWFPYEDEPLVYVGSVCEQEFILGGYLQLLWPQQFPCSQ